jgi:hypothetical protein
MRITQADTIDIIPNISTGNIEIMAEDIKRSEGEERYIIINPRDIDLICNALKLAKKQLSRSERLA